ncbi:MAG: hypothetical protein GXO23_00665 [Crenarchaeota archaeon]|nr:hypothetical protein [Thermoproteota archaeon]
MTRFHGIALERLHRHSISITYPHDLALSDDDTIVVDSMLGKLSQWLRMAGIRVEFSPCYRDEYLAEMGDIVVTRDEELFLRRLSGHRRTILLRSSDIQHQLSHMLDIIRPSLTYVPVSKYCTVCGGLLREVDVREVIERVPRRVSERFDRVLICERCGKIYWRGSHHVRIKERFVRAFKMCDLMDRVVFSVRDRVCMLRILNI